MSATSNGILGNVLSSATSLVNKRISNVNTLVQTFVNNMEAARATRQSVINSITSSGPLMGGTGILGSSGILGKLRGQVQELLGQVSYPQMTEQIVVPEGSYPAAAEPVTYAGVGGNTTLTIQQPSPLLVKLPVSSL